MITSLLLERRRVMDLVEANVQKAERKALVLGTLDDLFHHFVPAVFTVGYMVRECFWVHRGRGTGVEARRTLEYVYSMLMQLQAGEEQRSEYIRSVGGALLSWTRWHDDVSASLYVEEANEARLSRLATECLRVSSAVEVEDVCNLYINLGPPRPGLHVPSNHPVSRRLLNRVAENARLFWQLSPDDLAWTPWADVKLLRSATGWPHPLPRLPSRRTPVSSTAMKATLQHTLACIRAGQLLSGPVETFLRQNVPPSAEGFAVRPAPPKPPARPARPVPAPPGPPGEAVQAGTLVRVFDMGPPMQPLLLPPPAVPPPKPPAPHLVGIPLDPDAD